MALKIIVLEDDAVIAEAIAQALQDLGHEVCGLATSVWDMAALLAMHEPDLVTIDLNIGERHDGIGVATALQAGGPLAVVFITGAAEDRDLEQIKAVPGSSVVLKPFTTPDLRMGLALAWTRAREAIEDGQAP